MVHSETLHSLFSRSQGWLHTAVTYCTICICGHWRRCISCACHPVVCSWLHKREWFLIFSRASPRCTLPKLSGRSVWAVHLHLSGCFFSTVTGNKWPCLRRNGFQRWLVASPRRVSEELWDKITIKPRLLSSTMRIDDLFSVLANGPICLGFEAQDKRLWVLRVIVWKKSEMEWLIQPTQPTHYPVDTSACFYFWCLTQPCRMLLLWEATKKILHNETLDKDLLHPPSSSISAGKKKSIARAII